MQVFRDLIINKDSRYIDVVDGKIWGENSYFLMGSTKFIQRKVYVLISVSADIDFIW
jgi:hypothetical protein